MDRSALLVLICCITTCLADTGTFNGAFVGAVVVVTLLLSIIVSVGVFLLVVWMRWQRKEVVESTTTNGGGDIHLESDYTNSKREESESEIDRGKEVQEHYSEPIQSPPVYATVEKSTLRAPSPANSFTSDVDTNHYSNFGGNLRMPGVGDDEMLPKPSRPAPLVPESKTQDISSGKSDNQKPSRRAPPPKPAIWGENDTQATASSFDYTKEDEKEKVLPQVAHQRRIPPPKPAIWGENGTQATASSFDHTKEDEKEKVLPQVAHQRRIPPPKPTKWGQEEPKPTANSFHPSPVLPQITPAAVKLRPVPPKKTRSTGPPEPPAKPTSSGPPTPPVKPNTSGPPTPPANKPHFNIPSAPSMKQHTSGPPTPPVKPHPTIATPDTKPKPKPKPLGVGTSDSDDPSTSQQNMPRKPKLKPPIPAKPLSPGGKFGEEHTYSTIGQPDATNRDREGGGRGKWGVPTGREE